MNNVLYSFVLTIISGLSTIIGYFAIFIKGDKNKIISFALSFASGIMTTICLIDLIPSSFSYLNNFWIIFRLLYILLFIVIGFFLSSLMDKHLSLEHNGSLYRVGFLTMLGIIIHNIPEGIITFMVSQVDKSIGLSLAIAISLHNIPEGISISVPIYYATGSKIKAFTYTLISGLSEPLGALIAYLFLKNLVNDTIMGIIMAVIAGIMIQISCYELLPTSLKYKRKKITVLLFIIGTLFMLTNHFIFN